MPETAPVELFSVNPGGSEPDEIEYVYDPVPPAAESVEEYAVPTVALPVPQEPHTRFIGAATTMIVQVAVSVLPFLSTTLEVNV